MPFTENLDVFTADFGVPVVIAGATVRGVEDFRDVAAFDHAEVLVRQRVVLLKTSVAAGLAMGQVITVNGTARVVRDPRADEDGAFTVVALADG